VFEKRGDQDQAIMDDRALNDLTGISTKSLSVNHCVKGECEKTKGFIRYNGGKSLAKYNPSGPTVISVDSFVECKSDVDADIGGVTRNMDLCQAAGSSKPITGVGLISTSAGHLGRRSGTSYLYQRTGANVVGTAISGNYLYKEGDEMKVKSCINGNCQDAANIGYYINNDINTNEEKPLIYCTGAGSGCELKSKEENGYFLNSGTTEFVVCGNSGCIEKETTSLGSSCSEKYLVKYNSGYKYCDGTTLNQITSLKYYEVEDKFLPGKYFDYPSSFIDARVPYRKILIKTQQYSVTPVSTENIPVGYIKVGAGYMECKYGTEGNKECKPVTVSKTACDVAGELFKTDSGTKINLCLDSTNNIKVDLTTDTLPAGIDSEGQYIISVAGGLFGIGNRNDNRNYYVIIDVDSLGNVTVKEKEIEIKKYRYTDRSASTTNIYKLYDGVIDAAERAVDHICETGKIKAYEYEYIPYTVESGGDPTIDYYIEGNNNSEITSS